MGKKKDEKRLVAIGLIVLVVAVFVILNFGGSDPTNSEVMETESDKSAIAGMAIGEGSGSGAVSPTYVKLSKEISAVEDQISAVEDQIMCVRGDGTSSVECGGIYAAASGHSSTAMGYSTTASGSSSTAMGHSTTANGSSGSTAMGHSTTASGLYSTAMGYGTEASGDYASIAMGHSTTASGDYGSIATGYKTVASGKKSIAMGDGAVASGEISTAIGLRPEASGSYSMAIGVSAVASHTQSIVIASHSGSRYSCVSSADEEFRVCAEDMIFQIKGNEVPLSEVVDMLCGLDPSGSFC